MLLKMMRPFTALREVRRDDTGAAMAAVIGLMTVALLLSTLVASSVVTATGITSSTRAGVQSQAAAEAGLAAARSGLVAGTCGANESEYESEPDESPAYVATIWIPSNGDWERGCPPNLSMQVRIVSTGYADAPGVAGNSGRDETSIEAILSAESTPTQIVASGPAIYAYSSQGFSGGGTLVAIEGSNPAILIKTGDVNCTGGASGETDLVVSNGNLTVSGGCAITGNAWSSGRTTLPGGPDVGGDVVANGITITGGSEIGGDAWSSSDITLSGGVDIRGNASAQSMSFTSGGTIGGNVVVNGHVQFSGGGPDIKGNLTAGSFTTGSGGNVRKNAWIYGHTSTNWGAYIAGNLRTASLSKPGGMTFVGGTTTIASSPANSSPYATNPSAPPMPFVPDWVDFEYVPDDWTGFTTQTISSGGACTYAQLTSAIAAAAGTPVVVNALGCAGGLTLGGSSKVTLPNDLAIFAKSFNFSGSAGFQAASQKRLWLITPDTTPDNLPTCVTGAESFSITGGFSFSTVLRVMMYTPCKVVLSSSTNVRGQVFSGQAGISGGATLGYIAVGLPGVDLNTGQENINNSQEIDRIVVSLRNVSEGN